MVQKNQRHVSIATGMTVPWETSAEMWSLHRESKAVQVPMGEESMGATLSPAKPHAEQKGMRCNYLMRQTIWQIWVKILKSFWVN